MELAPKLVRSEKGASAKRNFSSISKTRRVLPLPERPVTTATDADPVRARLAYETDLAVREAILRTLGRLQNPVAIADLTAELTEPGASESCVAEAAASLGMLASLGTADASAIAAAVGAALRVPRLDPHGVTPGEVASPRQRPVVHDAVEVEAESRVAQLRQHDEGAARQVGGRDHRVHGAVVRRLVLPRDVELDGGEVQPGNLDREGRRVGPTDGGCGGAAARKGD